MSAVDSEAVSSVLEAVLSSLSSAASSSSAESDGAAERGNKEVTLTQQIQLLNKIISKIVEFPTETKYRRINRSKVTPTIGNALPLLELIGFQLNEDYLVLPSTTEATSKAQQLLNLLHTRFPFERNGSTSGEVKTAEQNSNANPNTISSSSVSSVSSTSSATTVSVSELSSASHPSSTLAMEIKSFQNELDFVKQQLFQRSAQLAILLSHEEVAKARTKRTKTPQQLLYEIAQATPATQDRVISLLRTIFNGLVQHPDNETYRSFPKSNLYPKLNEIRAAAELLECLGFKVGETTVFAPQQIDMKLIQSTVQQLEQSHSLQQSIRASSRESALAAMEAKAKKQTIPHTKMTEQRLQFQIQIQQSKEQLRELDSRVNALQQEYGTPFRIEWSIPLWSGKDTTEHKSLYSYPAVEMEQEKWRGCVQKLPNQQIALFLEALPKQRTEAETSSSSVCVSMAGFILHHTTRTPCHRPGVPVGFHYEQHTFTNRDTTWGWPMFIDLREARNIGAYEPKDDTITFRIDATIQTNKPAR